MYCFHIWDDAIGFTDHWFVFMSGKGLNSLISHARARDLEEEYYRCMAEMDSGRGGTHPDLAYGNRGFKKIGHEYVYQKYGVDSLIDTLAPIPSELVIPEKIGDVIINSVSDNAFREEQSIKKIILHKGIVKIGDCAFEGCTNLCEAVLANDSISIGKNAFLGTKLYKDEKCAYINHTFTKVDSSYEGVLTIRECVQTSILPVES